VTGKTAGFSTASIAFAIGFGRDDDWYETWRYVVSEPFALLRMGARAIFVMRDYESVPASMKRAREGNACFGKS
jgi:hypothetical protein